MTTEEKALALVKRVRQICTSSTVTDVCFRELADELERTIEREQAAIEAHEADKKAFSDVAKKVVAMIKNGESYNAIDLISPFILPEPVHPLVQAAADLDLFWNTDMGSRLESALAARGYKIVPKEADNG